MADLKFKSKVRAQGGIALPAETISRALEVDSNGEIKSSAVTSTELGYVSGVTSAIQTQINNANTAASDAQTDIDDHISDTTDAHAASAISNTPTGNLAATDVQGALNELQGDIDDLVTLSGVAAGSEDLGSFTGDIIPDNQTIKEALQSLETEIESLPAPFFYAGNYNATTNSPDLVGDSAFRISGAVYRTSVAGTQDFDAFGGVIELKVGDKLVYNGVNSVWEKWDVNDGDINSDDLTEGSTNLFFTDERAQDAVGNILIDSNTIDFTYNDGDNEISADVITQMSITSDASGIKLDGDAATPGNDKYYGTNGSGTKGFFDLPTGGSDNDLLETSFAIANDQSSAASVTGFAFSNTAVRGFKAIVTVEIDATLDLFETFEIIGVNKAGSFEIAQSAVGDESGVVFTITAGGQIQYTSANYAGFVAGNIRFRAETLSFA
jgi:hypothetical protein